MTRLGWLLLGLLAVVAVGVWWYASRRANYATNTASGEVTTNANTVLFTPADAASALAEVKKQYGTTLAKQIEKLTRFETGNYTSKQYKLTGTAGMQAAGSAPFYGWYSQWFLTHPQYTPVGTVKINANADALGDPGGNYDWVIFPSVTGFMLFLADYATRYANDGGIYRWASTDAATQAKYQGYLAAVQTPIVNNLT